MQRRRGPRRGAAVEELLPALGVDPRQPLRADLDYRHPIDLGEQVELATFDDEGCGAVACCAAGDVDVRAVARVGIQPLPTA